MCTARLRSSVFATVVGGVAVATLSASSFGYLDQGTKGDLLVPAMKVDCSSDCVGDRIAMAFDTVVQNDIELGTTTLVRVRRVAD